MPEFSLEIRTDYVGSSCNPTPHCFDLNNENIICYGSGRAVLLCRLENPTKVLSTHVGHTDRVNCLKWLKTSDGLGNYFVSCSVDKAIAVWMEEDEEYKMVAKVEGHEGPVNCLSGIQISSTSFLLVTTSSDSSTKVWKVTKDEENNHSIEYVDTLKLRNRLVLSLAMTLFQDPQVPLIACGAEDKKIYLHLLNGCQQFEEVIALPGHMQWVRCISFTRDGADILMASASQDCYVRIWRISKDVRDWGESELRLTSDLFTSNGSTYRVTLESVLRGHEGWVYSAHWDTQDGSGRPLKLLTSSMDKTIIVWEMDEGTGVWIEKVRLGEVGGSNLGFLGAQFSRCGDDILACSFHGAFHLWSKNKDSDIMEPGVTCGGHLGSVSDVCWSKHGEFLYSVGSDQTTRIHAQWDNGTCHKQWYEIARPQIHGYDMQSICAIDRFSFASGAEEKIVRVFKASKNFVTNFMTLSGASLTEKELDQFSSDGACVPALGLSNKSVSSTENSVMESGNYFVPQTCRKPPTEENLLQNTLWPEEQKLYGHGYEVFTLACNSDGSVLASSCKASQREHAAIILWDVATWRQISKLLHHSLTITQLAFSHDGQFLLSVSRDRTWSVFRRNSQEPTSYSQFSSCDQKTTLHDRIIWGCAWSHDDKYFVTVSRDKKAIIWCLECEDGEGCPLFKPASESLEAGESITSVDFAPRLLNGRYLLSLGMESGIMELYSWAANQQGASWQHLLSVDQSVAHNKMIKRMSFRPLNDSTSDTLQLATCSEDGSVKIFSLECH